jgi:hypothetical protein
LGYREIAMRATKAVFALAAAAALVAGHAVARTLTDRSVTPGVRLADYEAVYVAPVAVELKVDGLAARATGERAVDEADQQRKAGDLRQRLIDRIGASRRIVDAPSEKTLIVETTITRLQSSRPTQADYRRNPTLAFDSVYAGAQEARVQLSVDGAPVGSLRMTYDAALGDGRFRISVWDDADRAFDLWAVDLVDFIARN